MRVVGYVREAPGPPEGENAFTQSERIRRWIAESGHQLVAVCQDVRHSWHALGREGYRAMVGIVASGQVDAIVVSSLQTLSLDKIMQEILIWDLRSRGVTVLSAESADLDLLREPPEDPARMLIRDILSRLAEHVAESTRPRELASSVVEVETAEDPVVVELLPPDEERPQLSTS